MISKVIELGLKKLNQRKFLESLSILKKINSIKPNDGNVLFCLGNIYYELNDLDKSIKYYEKAIQCYPESESIINNYAIALQSSGNFKKAIKLFSYLINKRPNNIKAFFRLFRIDQNAFFENYYKYIDRKDIINNLEPEEKSLFYFIKSKYEKNKNNFDREIDFLNQAHEVYSKKYMKRSSYYTEFLKKNYDKFLLKKTNKIQEKNNINPIFIIGLPRSGSTLIESLISQNNENIYSYGETSIIDFSVISQVKKILADNTPTKKKVNIEINQDLLKESINNIYNYSNKNSFIDKSLENFFYIDLILNIFPNAKFIHTFRDKYEAAIAIYQSMLIYLPWAHSIKDIIKYIINYENIINYFKIKYPDNILDVKLEEFTSYTREQTKIIFNFCNLKLNENRIDFFNNRNLKSKSSSFEQIRNKIVKTKLDKYKPYYHLIQNEKFKL